MNLNMIGSSAQRIGTTSFDARSATSEGVSSLYYLQSPALSAPLPKGPGWNPARRCPVHSWVAQQQISCHRCQTGRMQKQAALDTALWATAGRWTWRWTPVTGMRKRRRPGSAPAAAPGLNRTTRCLTASVSHQCAAAVYIPGNQVALMVHPMHSCACMMAGGARGFPSGARPAACRT